MKGPAGQNTHSRIHFIHAQRLYLCKVLTNNRKEFTDGLIVRAMVYFQNNVWSFVCIYITMCVIGTGNRNVLYMSVCVRENDLASIIVKPIESCYLFQMGC